MSRFMRLKHVHKEMMKDEFTLPTKQQQIVRVKACRGNNLHEVESDNSDVNNFLVTMPTKFRNSIFIRRGDFMLVEPIEEGVKVKAEIVKILTNEHINEYTKAGVWPKRFTKEPEVESSAEEEDVEDDDDDDEFIVRNKNRPAEKLLLRTEETDSDEESDYDDDDDEENELESSSSAEEEDQEL